MQIEIDTRAMSSFKLMEAANSGKIFSVTFIKKDGSKRKMLARKGVRKNLTGKGMKYKPLGKGLLPVFDMQKKAYRIINLMTVLEWKANGVLHIVR